MTTRLFKIAQAYAYAATARVVPFDAIRAVIYYKLVAQNKRPFRFLDTTHPYLYHSYNNYGMTERSAEMPIVRHYLTSAPWTRVLEIGNVTAYYEDYFVGLFPNKVVVDKYERDWKVVTADVAGFADPDRFDFIFSVSTFEHMDSDGGRNPDYRPGSSTSATVACDNIRHVYEHLLRPGGLFVITAPLGYSPEWDATVHGTDLDRSGFSQLRRHRVSRTGPMEWRTFADSMTPGDYAYGRPFPYANHLAVLEIRKNA